MNVAASIADEIEQEEATRERQQKARELDQVERTGKHYCIKCLKPMARADYFAGDHACVDCAEWFAALDAQGRAENSVKFAAVA